MNKNDLIIYEFNQLDISDLSEEQQVELAQDIISNVNIRQLENKIHECILNLSGVGGPCLGADTVYIALDNQKRLEFVHQLLYFLDIFKADVSHLKRAKKDYIDGEQIYSFLHYTKELINTVYEYGNFKKEDIETQIRQLEESKNKNILSYFNNVHVVKELPNTENSKIEELDTLQIYKESN